MNEIGRQFGKYLLVGLLNTAITLGLIYVLIVWFAWHHVAANCLGYVVGFAVSFFLNRMLTFRSRGPWIREIWRFLGAFGVSYAMSVSSLLILHRLRLFPYAVTTAISMGVYTVASFAITRRFVFLHGKNRLASGDESLMNCSR